MSAEILKGADRPSRDAVTRYCETRISQLHKSLETDQGDAVSKNQGAISELRKLLVAIDTINKGKI
jgi:hypothetical protein